MLVKFSEKKIRFWSKFSKNFEFFENFEKYQFSQIFDKKFHFSQNFRKISI